MKEEEYEWLYMMFFCGSQAGHPSDIRMDTPYKEKKPKDPTIAEKFNTYRFADHKEQVVDLLERVCTVSVEKVRVVGEMENTFG